ncbi:MAG: hypothetical protein ABI972_16620 [Acidobacteriota bacterium]
MNLSWLYPPTQQSRVQGRGLAEDNFAQESKSSLEILMREGLQNPLDASDGSGKPVRVTLRLLSASEVDQEYLGQLINEEYLTRLEASSGQPLNGTPATALVIEDFGTTGLLGTYQDSTVDGDEENWNAFWFREGEGAKAGKSSNGRAGQGKITFYRMGAARAVFGLTSRADGQSLLMGRSSFRSMYTYQKTKFERDAFWCTAQNDHVLPLSEATALDTFRRAFRLKRQYEPGLSIVIPYPVAFNEKDALLTVVSEFYYPIARGRLEVQIGTTLVTSAELDSIADELLPNELARDKGSSFTKGYRSFVREVIKDEGKVPIVLAAGWEEKSAIPETAFPAGALETLRKMVDNERHVTLRCPIKIRPRKGSAITTHFDVHLQVPDGLERVEEAYIRGDLLIGAETHLANMTYLPKARGLTIAEDPNMSRFLAEAEEPTHLKWNASRPRLAEEYFNPILAVRAVRLALPRLLTVISGGIPKRDVKALAKYFTKPADEATHRKTTSHKPGKTIADSPVDPPPLPPPPQQPKPRPFCLTTDTTSVSVVPNGTTRLTPEKLPASCVLELAYEGLDDDPFADYDPFDFDLANEKVHQTVAKGIVVQSRQWNHLEFEVTDADFSFSIDGFDPNIRLRARLNYEENQNGSSIDAQ